MAMGDLSHAVELMRTLRDMVQEGTEPRAWHSLSSLLNISKKVSEIHPIS